MITDVIRMHNKVKENSWRTNAVMAQPDHPEEIKQKVQAVREVITDRKKTDVHLVLEHYAYDVERTIQAFLEDGAKEALDQWQCLGSKAAPKKKKKNKKQTKDPDLSNSAAVNQSTQESHDTSLAPPTVNGLNGDISSESIPERVSEAIRNAAPTPFTKPSSISENLPTSQPKAHAAVTSHTVNHPLSHHQDTTKHAANHQLATQTMAQSTSKPSSQSQSHKFSYKPNKTGVDKSTDRQSEPVGKNESHKEKVHTSKPTHTDSVRPKTLEGVGGGRTREKSQSELIGDTIGPTVEIKPAAPNRGLDKSTKDLQRQISSLIRLKSILEEEITKAQKDMSKKFEEARNSLENREVALMVEMDKMKAETSKVLAGRQKTAAELKARAERVSHLTELECLELRADIKHFVSDRKVDEELASSAKFQCDYDGFMQQVNTFGTVPPVKNHYSTRRPSISSLSLNSSISSAMSPPMTPLSPPTPSFTTPLNPYATPFVAPEPLCIPNAVKINPPPTIHNLSGAKVLAQSESLTKFESSTDMSAILNKTKEHQQSKNRRSTTPAGRARSTGRGQGQRQPPKPKVQAPTDSPVDINASPSPEDNKKSRSARRRQRQKERQKEQNESRKTSVASEDGVVLEKSASTPNKPKVLAVGDNKLNAAPKPASNAAKPERDNSARGGSNARGGRTPSPTKRHQQRGQGDGPRKDNAQGQVKLKEDASLGQRSSSPKTLSPRPAGRGRGRGQGSKSYGEERATNEGQGQRQNSTQNAAKQISTKNVAKQNSTKSEAKQNSTQSTANIPNGDIESHINKDHDKNTHIEVSVTKDKIEQPKEETREATHNEQPKIEMAINSEIKQKLSTGDKKSVLREEFRYSESSGSTSSLNSIGTDLKKEANNNSKTLNGDVNHLSNSCNHSNLPNGDVINGNGDVTDTHEHNGSNNSNNVDALPQRKQRPNRSANRKLPKCDIVIGQEEQPMKNGDVDFNEEVNQHRWSNEEE